MTAIAYLADYRPDPDIPDGLSVAPMLTGKIGVAIGGKEGPKQRIVLTVEEAKRHVLECQDAIELVEGVLR